LSDFLTEADLRDALGAEATAALLAAFGGRRTYIPGPDRIGPEHPLARAMGEAPARLLAALVATGHGGATVELPLGGEGAAARRQRRGVAALEAGATVNAVAGEFGVTARTVRRWRARHRRRKAGKGDET
jgi:Mor family transcriptional regulator